MRDADCSDGRAGRGGRRTRATAALQVVEVDGERATAEVERGRGAAASIPHPQFALVRESADDEEGTAALLHVFALCGGGVATRDDRVATMAQWRCFQRPPTSMWWCYNRRRVLLSTCPMSLPMEHDIATDEPTILPGRPPRHHLLSAARRRRDAPARRDAVVAARMLPWPEGAATVVAA